MSTQILKQRLAIHHNKGLTRAITTSHGVDLSSNDYLGFAQDPQLQINFMQRLNHSNYPAGATGSRLLTGNLQLFEETEALLAQFVQSESAFLFPSGYQANLALLSALLRNGDIVFSDVHNHASIIDGIRLTRAEKITFPHRHYDALEAQLKINASRRCLKIIISESLFSMEGTLANIATLATLAEKYDALLIIDEAHSTGIWGPSLVTKNGLRDRVFATVHTSSKALGCAGAWIAGNQLLKNYLINFARPVLFSTAPLPALAILLQEAIYYYQRVGMARANQIMINSQILRQLLSDLVSQQENTPILAIILKDNLTTIKIAHHLQNLGWQIYAIRSPTVPINTARLRITVKWLNNAAQLTQFAAALNTALTEYST